MTQLPTTTLTPKTKLAAGRLMAVNKLPYFRAAIMGMIPHEAPGLGTFAVTDNAVFLWDQEACKRWTVNQIAAVIVHEVSHLMRNHGKRCKCHGADADIWNLAADAEINDDGVFTGDLQLPDSPVLPKTYGLKDGQLAETYYDWFRKNTVRVKVTLAGGAGQGQQGKKGQGQPQGGAGGQQPQQGKGKGKGGSGGGQQAQTPEAPQAGGGWCGSAGGRRVPQEPDEATEPGRTEVDVERIRRETARAIQDHVQKGRGSVPAGWKRWADETMKPPKVPWRTKLARMCRGTVAQLAGCTDYRYTRPPRRQSAVGYGDGCPVLPIMRSPKPEGLIVVDTSGSMSTKELSIALRESNGVLKALGTDVQFMASDAAVHEIKTVRNWKEIVPLLKGGGGTDFTPPIDAAEKLRKRPNFIIFITDGCGPVRATPPKGIAVIWLLVGSMKQHPHFGTWGKGAGKEWGEFIELDDTGDEYAESEDAA